MVAVGEDLRDSWSMPLPKEIFTVHSQGEDKDATAHGVAEALGVLLEDYYRPGWVPAVFNERRAPLCGVGGPMPTWPFAEQNHNLGFPSFGVLRDFVLLLVARLHLSVGETVLAYTILERALLTEPTIMRCYSIRPMFLGATVLACKLTRDNRITVEELRVRLDDVLKRLELSLLKNIELQMLFVLRWRVPLCSTTYQMYADEIFATASMAFGPMASPVLLLESWEDPSHFHDSVPAHRRAATTIQACVRGNVDRTLLAQRRGAACIIQTRLRLRLARRAARAATDAAHIASILRAHPRSNSQPGTLSCTTPSPASSPASSACSPRTLGRLASPVNAALVARLCPSPVLQSDRARPSNVCPTPQPKFRRNHGMDGVLSSMSMLMPTTRQ